MGDERGLMTRFETGIAKLRFVAPAFYLFGLCYRSDHEQKKRTENLGSECGYYEAKDEI